MAAVLQPPLRNYWKRRAAFTLIEVLVVVGILGLVLAIGAPAFVRALHKEGMRKAESDLLEACQKARGGAILKASDQELIIHPMDRSFEAPGAYPATTLPENVSIVSISIDGEDLDPGQTEIVPVHFHSRGTSDEFSIVIRDDSTGTTCTISLDEVTALADISTSQ